MTIGKAISTSLAVAVILAFSITAMTQAAVQEHTLEGAWNVTIAFQDPALPKCAPAGAVVTAVSPGSGTLIAESCYASEGAGYGAWIRTAHNQFAITFLGNSFGPTGTVVSTYKVRASVSLGPTANSFAGPFKTEAFDLAGNSLGTATGRVSGVRIVAKP